MKTPWKLKKNNFFVKLMRFTWNLDHRDFKWMCAFTWLSVFNLLALPFTVLIKYVFFRGLIKGVILNVASNITEQREEKLNIWCAAQLSALGYDVEGRTEYDLIFLKKVCKSKRTTFWNYLYDTNMPLYNKLQIHRKVLELELEKKEEDNRAKRKKVAMKVATNAKPFAIGLLWLVGAAVLFFAGYGLYLLFSSVEPADWREVLRIALLVIGLVVGLILVIVFIYIVVDALHDNCACKKFCCKAGNAIARPFAWFWNLLVGFGQLIRQTVSDNCPAIDWED